MLLNVLFRPTSDWSGVLRSLRIEKPQPLVKFQAKPVTPIVSEVDESDMTSYENLLASIPMMPVEQAVFATPLLSPDEPEPSTRGWKTYLILSLLFIIGASTAIIGYSRTCPAKAIRHNDKCIQCPLGRNADSTACICPELHTWDTNAASCQCQAGYVHHFGACQKCQPGTFSLGSTECSDCPTGTWSSAGDEFCSICAVDYYGLHANGRGHAACTPCVSGAHSPKGSVAASSCICVGDAIMTDGACNAKLVNLPVAPIETVADSDVVSEQDTAVLPAEPTTTTEATITQSTPLTIIASTTQVPQDIPECKAGFFSSSDSIGCQHCPEGSWSTPGSLACLLCAANWYGQSTETKGCLKCPDHSTSPVESSALSDCHCEAGYKLSESTCEACSPGEFSGAGALTCNACPGASWSKVASSSCSICRANYYGEDAMPHNNQCFACFKGAESPAGSTNREMCKCPLSSILHEGECLKCEHGGKVNEGECKCLDGQSWNATTAQCRCPKGHKINDGRCVQCPEGTFSPAGSHICLKCTAPTWSEAGSETCSICAAGYYGATVGNAKDCQKCFKDATSRPGSLSIDDCKCNAGLFLHKHQCIKCESHQTLDEQTGLCRCEPGYITSVNGCEKCPAGTFSSDLTTCSSCPALSLSVAGSRQLSDCKCKAGYKLEGNTCIECDEGTFGKRDSNKCSECILGSWSYKGREYCSICAAGYYGGHNVDFHATCTKCYTGSTSTQGSISAANCKCPDNAIKHRDECVTCELARHVDETRCICPDGQTWNSDSAKCLCAPGKIHRGGSCEDCPAGTFTRPGANECILCSDTLSQACKECEVYCQSKDHCTCPPCMARSPWSEPGSQYCSICAAGDYGEMTPGRHNAGCLPCFAGSTSEMNTALKEQCKCKADMNRSENPPGCVCVDPAKTIVAGNCELTPTVLSQTAPGVIMAPPATSETSQSSTTLCASGTFWDFDNNRCRCKGGRKLENGNCKKCSEGTFSRDGISCEPCGDDQVSSAGAPECSKCVKPTCCGDDGFVCPARLDDDHKKCKTTCELATTEQTLITSTTPAA